MVERDGVPSDLRIFGTEDQRKRLDKPGPCPNLVALATEA